MSPSTSSPPTLVNGSKTTSPRPSRKVIPSKPSSTTPSRRPTDRAILKFIVILVFFLALHISGIYFFTRGFLLTRLVLDAKSNCSSPPVLSHTPSSQQHSQCWYPQQFKKAIIVLIDALRYDFTVPYPPAQAEWYHNAFTTPYNLAATSPENAFLLK